MILKVVIFYALQSADAVKRNIKSVPLMNRILNAWRESHCKYIR